ncbi:hypothetical protein BDD12DRAFT_819097 [Trichophaea hybrida]|nr:hypothetical protein BDD12DRAFT_819097 [Trichophaea hybrida]
MFVRGREKTRVSPIRILKLVGCLRVWNQLEMILHFVQREISYLWVFPFHPIIFSLHYFNSSIKTLTVRCFPFGFFSLLYILL